MSLDDIVNIEFERHIFWICIGIKVRLQVFRGFMLCGIIHVDLQYYF